MFKRFKKVKSEELRLQRELEERFEKTDRLLKELASIQTTVTTTSDKDSEGFWTVISIVYQRRKKIGQDWEEATLKAKAIDRDLAHALAVVELTIAKSIEDKGGSLFKEEDYDKTNSDKTESSEQSGN